ncbi:response regulator transcription factor [Streptomyces sp. NPDC004082]|uniref:response regulator transcription factor n=1 Tax=Streptomyces sp. NPDC005481 TaxID=3154881 RepID=UPI0033A8F472
MASVLLVEDDPSIRTHLTDFLSGQGHVVRSTSHGFEALREVTQRSPDIVILDLGLPDLDGIDVLRMIRGISQVPVLVATARDEEAEVIRLLNTGADDYVVKPFSGGELLARLGAVLRRTTSRSAPGTAYAKASSDTVRVGGLLIDPGARTAHLDGVQVPLTRREFDLLLYLARHSGRVVSRQRILTDVWRQAYVEDQTLDVHVSALRRKLGERAARPRYLHTVRGVGIKLVSPA